jgi:hypothetical protein
MKYPRPAARSCEFPRSIAVAIAEELARSLGADAKAAKALRSAFARADGYRFALVVHRADRRSLTDDDLLALRGMQPVPRVPASRQPPARRKATAKRAAAKASRTR